MRALTLKEVVMNMAKEERDFSTGWRERIEDWLQEEGWQVGHQSAEGTRWVLTMRDGQGRPLALGYASAGRDRLLIQMGITVADDIQEALAQLTAQERRNLVFDIHEGLITIGVQWTGIGEPLRQFTLESTCYLGDLSKGELLNRVRGVRDGGILVMEKIFRILNQAPPAAL